MAVCKVERNPISILLTPPSSPLQLLFYLYLFFSLDAATKAAAAGTFLERVSIRCFIFFSFIFLLYLNYQAAAAAAQLPIYAYREKAWIKLPGGKVDLLPGDLFSLPNPAATDGDAASSEKGKIAAAAVDNDNDDDDVDEPEPSMMIPCDALLLRGSGTIL